MMLMVLAAHTIHCFRTPLTYINLAETALDINLSYETSEEYQLRAI